jgi:quinol monooxygenase YgiN
MYGTVARISPIPGREQEVIRLFEDWDRNRAPQARGYRSAYLFKPESRPQELIMVAVFDDKESYMANAGDPAQDAWYRRLRALLTADPRWEDSECLIAHSKV